MTEPRADDSRERERSAVAKPQELSVENQRQARKDVWEALQQGTQHSNGGARRRVGDLPYLDKGLQRQPSARGGGDLIMLFGYGLIIAAFSVLAWIFGAVNRVFLPKRIRENPFTIPHPQLFWTTAACALLSTFLMAAAILIAVFKFGTL